MSSTEGDERGFDHPERPPVPWIAPAMIFLFVVFGGFFVFDQSQRPHRRESKTPACIGHQKLILLASFMYSGDYDDHFPSAPRWVDEIEPYLKSADVLQCPNGTGTAMFGYAVDCRLSKVTQIAIPDPASRIYVFDSTSGFRNASDPLTSSRAHKDGRLFAGYLDGHVSMKTASSFRAGVIAAGGKP